MARPRVTTLGYALLGLIRAEPRSGYALRMQFARTPLGHFSSSPGSIYPALKSLEAADLVHSAKTDTGQSQYRLTHAGQKALCKWLTQPVDHLTFDRTEDEYLLRFALLSDAADSHMTLVLLQGLTEAWDSRLAKLLTYRKSAAYRALPLHGRLSVDFGVNSVRAALRWAKSAGEALRQERLKCRPPRNIR